MTRHSPFEAALRRERLITLGALALVVIASWIWILSGAGMGMSAIEMSSARMALGLEASARMSGMEMSMATPADWNAGYAVLMFAMWWVMMLAMMLPSAAPTILLFAAIKRRGETTEFSALSAIVSFTAGYGAVWAAFSALAVILQWMLEDAGLLAPMMMSASSMTLAGVVLVAAGLYQLTPLKQACLRHCRSPAHFISQHWRKTAGGAFSMGARHGVYCLGCCWALMALLFFGGVMNLWWIAGLAAIVAVEKLTPRGVWFGYVLGTGLAFWGASFLWRALA